MATVVTVHGTFAHSAGTADALGLNENADLQWWQAGSSFEAHTRELVQGADGKLDFAPFVWSSVQQRACASQCGIEPPDDAARPGGTPGELLPDRSQPRRLGHRVGTGRERRARQPRSKA